MHNFVFQTLSWLRLSAHSLWGLGSGEKNGGQTCVQVELYKAAILPNLTYCHTVWHFCKASDTIKLERVQERALRAVYNSKMADYDELLSKAKLPSLVNRRLQDILILMYKVKNLLAPKHICDIFYKQFKNYD